MQLSVVPFYSLQFPTPAISALHTHTSAQSFPWFTAMLYVVLGVLWLLYFYAAVRPRTTPWSRWRCLSWSAGIIIIAIALYPPFMHLAHQDFTVHMWSHLLLGMFGPLGLVLAAPVTLAMQTLSPRSARRLFKTISWPFFQVVSHPVSAMFLNVGAMYLLYMTPLYYLSLQNSWLSFLVHWHFLVAGYLFTWSIAGPDPAPTRPSMKFRCFVLFFSVGAHATLAKIMYAYQWPRLSPHSVTDIQAGAQLMYWGGDVAELLLIIAFFAIWFKRTPAHPAPAQRNPG